MQIGRLNVWTGKRGIKILVAAGLLVSARMLFDIASASAYVFPEHNFSQGLLALLLLFAVVFSVFVFAIVRLFQRKFIEGVALLIAIGFVFFPIETIERHSWKFRVHKAEYKSTIRGDQSPPPKYHVFNWKAHNAFLGGGIVVEGIVFDESDEIARKPEARSSEWIARRSNQPPDDLWVTEFPVRSPPCRRIIEPYGEHFYYLAVEC